MLMKTKQKWLGVCVISLGVAVSQVNATGIPVFDGAAAEHNAWEKTIQWRDTVEQYTKISNNWVNQFKQMARGQLTKLTGVNLNESEIGNKNDYLKMIQKQKDKCTTIKNTSSQNLCVAMAVIDERKIDALFDSLSQIKQESDKLDSLIKEQQRLGNAGEKNTAENAVSQQLENISRIVKTYNQRIALLDQQKAHMQEAREIITREQLRGNVNNTAAKLAIITTLQARTASYKDKAKLLRQNNKKVSQDAFSSSLKNK